MRGDLTHHRIESRRSPFEEVFRELFGAVRRSPLFHTKCGLAPVPCIYHHGAQIVPVAGVSL